MDELHRSLLAVMTTGEEAEEAIGSIAVPAPTIPRSLPLIGEVASRWERQPRRSAPADQVRRACTALDGFATDLRDLTGALPINGLYALAATADTWSDRLWAETSASADVYNEVRGAMATLHRYRNHLLLGHPVERFDDGVIGLDPAG
ncbi:MAG: hypothetical protein AAF547_03745 [Actinomycetota bacterium]